MNEPPGGIITPRVHIGCGGTVLWDPGGYCTRCHAENLEPDEAERAPAFVHDPRCDRDLCHPNCLLRRRAVEDDRPYPGMPS